MSRQTDRDEFIALMTQEGVPVGIAAHLMRYAATLHRLAELECSSEAAYHDTVPCPGAQDCLCGDYGTFNEFGDGEHGEIPRYALQGHRLERTVRTLCKPYNLIPVFDGDPRGAVLKLKVPSGKTNDWGQTGVCVP